jgi:hypothetical protein
VKSDASQRRPATVRRSGAGGEHPRGGTWSLLGLSAGVRAGRCHVRPAHRSPPARCRPCVAHCPAVVGRNEAVEGAGGVCGFHAVTLIVFFFVFLLVIMAPYLMAILRSSCRNNGEAMTITLRYEIEIPPSWQRAVGEGLLAIVGRLHNVVPDVGSSRIAAL